MPTQASPQQMTPASSPSALPLPEDAARSPYGGSGSSFDRPGNPADSSTGSPYDSPPGPYDSSSGGSAGSSTTAYASPGGHYAGEGGGRHRGADSRSADAPDPYSDAANPFSGTSDPYGASGGRHGGAGGAYAGSGGRHRSADSPYAGSGGQYGGAGSPYGAPGGYYGDTGGAYGSPSGGSPYAYPGQPYSRKTSGWAIASFVLGLLGGVVLSVVFGFIALSRIKRFGQQGRGFAIAGFVLSGVWTILLVILIITGGLHTATRSPSTGKITHGGSLSVFSLAVGDCFNTPTDSQDVATVTAEPCNQPHSAQVYAKFKLTGSDFSYPGTTTAKGLASKGCGARIGSIDRSKTTSAMTVRFLFPDQTAWLAGQRTVSCIIFNPTATVTHSLLKS